MTYHTPNPNRDLVCCLTCGRDTRNKSSICKKCQSDHDHHDEKPKTETLEELSERMAELPVDALDDLLGAIEDFRE